MRLRQSHRSIRIFAGMSTERLLTTVTLSFIKLPDHSSLLIPLLHHRNEALNHRLRQRKLALDNSQRKTSELFQKPPTHDPLVLKHCSHFPKCFDPSIPRRTESPCWDETECFEGSTPLTTRSWITSNSRHAIYPITPQSTHPKRAKCGQTLTVAQSRLKRNCGLSLTTSCPETRTPWYLYHIPVRCCRGRKTHVVCIPVQTTTSVRLNIQDATPATYIMNVLGAQGVVPSTTDAMTL
jgi:hypothetical protein